MGDPWFPTSPPSASFPAEARVGLRAGKAGLRPCRVVPPRRTPSNRCPTSVGHLQSKAVVESTRDPRRSSPTRAPWGRARAPAGGSPTRRRAGPRAPASRPSSRSRLRDRGTARSPRPSGAARPRGRAGRGSAPPRSTTPTPTGCTPHPACRRSPAPSCPAPRRSRSAGRPGRGGRRPSPRVRRASRRRARSSPCRRGPRMPPRGRGSPRCAARRRRRRRSRPCRRSSRTPRSRACGGSASSAARPRP